MCGLVEEGPWEEREQAPWPPLQTSQACPGPLKSHPSVDDTEAATKLTTVEEREGVGTLSINNHASEMP